MKQNQIKADFQEQYNKSIRSFNECDYEYYFFHVRKAIELFGKFLIFDVLTIKGEEDKAPLIINGDSKFDIDYKNKSCKYVTQQQDRQPEGSFFVTLAKFALYYSFPLLLDPGTEPKLKRIKVKVDSCLDSMINYYNTASEVVMHTNESTLDKRTQSNSCVSFFIKSFNDLKQFISDETSLFLSSLDAPEKTPEPKDSMVEEALHQNNDFSILDSITNFLSQSSGEQYIILLPEKLLDRFGNHLSNSQLQDFYRLRWNFVVDLDKKTSDGMYEQAFPNQKSTIRIISDNLSEVTGTFDLTNWMFAKGRVDLGGYDERNTLKNAPKMFCKTFSKLVRTGLTNDYVIFDFCEENSKLVQKFLDKLEDVFEDWDGAANRCQVISFTKMPLHKEMLSEWSDYTGVKVNYIEAGFGDFLNHVAEIKPQTGSSLSKLLIRGKSLDLTEAKERYHAAGIDFYGQKISNKEKPQWDFYSGAEITWDELEQQFDVQREIYRTVRQKIIGLIRNNRKTIIFTLRHRPGSGATTLSRRLGYDVYKDDEQGIISCTAINIRSCGNLRITEQYLCQLSEKTDNTPILAIVESKHIGREKFDYLVKRMSDAGKKIIFFYVEPYTLQYHTQKDNVVLLESNLKQAELQRFEDKYKQLGLDEAILTNSKKGRNTLEVVDFPLMLKDKETCSNLSSYVQEWMSELPENLKKFCAFVSFVFKYSDLGVNQMLLKSIWRNDNIFTIMSYPANTVTAIKKLLIEETTEDGKFTGVWRPRYNIFSTFILAAYKNNWEAGLSEISKEFISLCKNAGELGSDDKDMLYSVFVIRKNADYRALEDKGNLRNKFSLLIKDLNDVERAESLFEALVDAFPDDAVFRGHFARFLYEKATMSKSITIDDRLFVDAQSQLNQAFDINSDDADLYHMQGMLLRRKIAALGRMFQMNLQHKEFDEIDIKSIRDCLEEWVQDAYDAFENSIAKSPASPYGYAAESQLFKEAIELGQKLLRAHDYSFCETDFVFSDYTEKLGNVLDLFEQICYAFKNDGLSQIINSYHIYENVRAFHENLVGRNKESITRYRTLYQSASDDKKMLYGSLLCKAIVYSKTPTRNTMRAYRNLTHQEVKEIETILNYQKNKGDIKSYETMFMLKLYGNEEFSIDESIDLLKEWERQYDDENKQGWGYLNACFYLAVCYCAKSIKGGIPNLELTSLASTYFRRAEEYAKKFDKGTVLPQCYLGERDDIHCIVSKDMKDQEAGTITGVIQNIRNNKGILKMLCGVEVSFNAKDFEVLRDEGQTLRGVLGFSYSGPGLYDFRIENDPEKVWDNYSEEDITFEDLERSYVPAEDLVEETGPEETDNQLDSAVTKPQNGPKIIGKLDPSILVKTKSKTQIPKGGYTSEVDAFSQIKGRRGKISSSRDKVYDIITKKYLKVDRKDGFAIDCSPKNYDYSDNEEVVFDLRESNRPNFYFAVNIQPACDID